MPRRTAAALVLAAALWAPAAQAEPDAGERAAIQSVISAQIEAFRRDDGAAAFGFAGEPIRRMFGTPETFLAMVRKGYAAVYRPKSVVFGAVSDGAAGPEQEVLITDEAGVDWVARYTLERQGDGTWRILGCRLVKNEGGAA